MATKTRAMAPPVRATEARDESVGEDGTMAVTDPASGRVERNEVGECPAGVDADHRAVLGRRHGSVQPVAIAALVEEPNRWALAPATYGHRIDVRSKFRTTP